MQEGQHVWFITEEEHKELEMLNQEMLKKEGRYSVSPNHFEVKNKIIELQNKEYERRHFYRDFLDPILIFRNQIKQKLRHNHALEPQLKANFDALEAACLESYFEDTLKAQKEDVSEMRKVFNKDFTTHEHQKFLNNTLASWEHRLNRNKPIQIPTWNHCTKPGYVDKILKSGVLVTKSGTYYGCFFSNWPEEGDFYGHYGFSFSPVIEEQVSFRRAPTHDDLVFYPPRQSFYQESSSIQHGSRLPPKELENPSSSPKKTWWGADFPIPLSGSFNFEVEESDEPYLKRLKNRSPTLYYEQRSLAFVFCPADKKWETKNNVGRIYSPKVKVIVISKLDAFFQLRYASLHLFIPPGWGKTLEARHRSEASDGMQEAANQTPYFY